MDVLGEVETTPVAIAFPKDSDLVDEFNQALVDMRNSGELDLLVQQWFTVDP